MTDSLREEEDDIHIDLGKIGSFFKKLGSDDDEEQPKKGKETKQKKPRKKRKHAGSEKKAREREEPEEEKDSSDDEIAIDLGAIGSKLKGLFKSDGKEREQKSSDDEGDEDELSINFGGAFDFLKSYKHFVLPAVFIIIALFLSVSLRMQSATLPITDNWATSNIHNMIRNDIASTVYGENPTLPAEHREKLTDNLFKEAIQNDIYTFQTGQYAGQSFNIDQQIGLTSESLKGQLKDDNDVTYLLAIDSWQQFRKVRNKIETGHFYDELKNEQYYDFIRKIEDGWVNEPWNNYMFAPQGKPMEVYLHHDIGYWLYKIMHAFKPDTTPMGAFFLVPVLVAALAIIPAFFITKRVGGDLGGFFAAVIVAIHPVFLGRTAGGFADTDAYAVTLPLFIAWAFLEAFEGKNLRKKISLGILAGFLTGVTAYAWIGWWYIFDFIIAMVGIYMVTEVVRSVLWKRELDIPDIISRLKLPAILLLVFFITSALFVTLFSGSTAFQSFYTQPFSFAVIKEVAKTKIWPNVYTTVAEMNPANFASVKANISFNKLSYFYLSIIGILLTLIRPMKGKKIDVKYAIFLTIWFVGSIYASLKGVRFIIVLVPAFSIALGVFAGLTVRFGTKWLMGQFKFNKTLAWIILSAMVLLLLVHPFRTAQGTAMQEIPSMNDDWYGALSRIDAQAAPDAIINSWWDFGHWFKAIANRRVTFDGASQNTPQAHWIGRTLLTENENEAVGILRMLDCGGNAAFNALNRYLDDEVTSIKIIYEIILMDKETARARLEEIISPDEAEIVLQYSHCDPPENYFITSGDMVSKSGVWAHFGSWDMRRAAMYNLVKGKESTAGINILTEQFGLEDNEARMYYYEIQTEEANDWIAQWPSYWASGSCQNDGEMVLCQTSQISFLLNRTTGEVSIPTADGDKKFYSVAFIDSKGDFQLVKEDDPNRVLNNGGVKFGVVVHGFPNPTSFVVTTAKSDGPQLASEWLPGSMFSRLYFFHGYGLNHFEQFDRRGSSMGDIITWKVAWDGGLKDSVKPGNKVLVNYMGWTDEGAMFDSSIIGWESLNLNTGMSFDDYETLPLPHTYGAGGLIPGFDEGLAGMVKGESKTISIPPEMAYGTDPTAHPLGNKTLNFKIQVVKIA